ncbi:hypothetical protein [Lunatimonas salinarum]|nr:hypothetical protein [Lunatimonas salinarum]
MRRTEREENVPLDIFSEGPGCVEEPEKGDGQSPKCYAFMNTAEK